jgi:hypothetical protein
MLCRSSAHAAAPLALLTALVLISPGQRSAFAQANVPAADGASAASDPQAQAPPPIAPPRSGGFMGEPGFLTTAISLGDRFGESTGRPKSGFYPELSNMITGAGWLAVGPGYRQYFADDKMMFETSAALSWRMYKMAQARLEAQQLANGHLVLGTQAAWADDTQVSYFGVGPDISEDDRSQYRLQTHDIVGYGHAIPNDWLTISGELGWLGHPKFMEPGGTFKRDFPTTRDAFPFDPAAGLSVQPALLHSEASIAADTRDHRGHPTHGVLYRGALTNYWDRTYDVYTFHTWEAEALQYIPVADNRVVFALHAWTVAAQQQDGRDIPLYLQPALGGSRTLRDYHDYQFHDRNLLVVNAESRFAVWTHLDAALFADAGNAASRFRDLDLDKTSYGVGVRLHNETTTLARLDMAHGEQGWRMNFSTTEALRLPRTRTKRVAAQVPFAP